MYCPKCSEQVSSRATRFCTRCGADLGGDRRTGLKQGFVLLALGLIMVPVWMFVGAAFPPNDRLVESAPSTTPAESIAWIFMWAAFIAAAARMGYAFLFEKAAPRQETTERNVDALPSGDTFEPAAKPGRWRTTHDLGDANVHGKRASGDLT